jgi:broad specificity phosphatase PhoE
MCQLPLELHNGLCVLQRIHGACSARCRRCAFVAVSREPARSNDCGETTWDDGGMGELILLRHGQTEWSAAGRHTGRTDIPLTPKGVADAAALAPMVTRRIAGDRLVAVFASPAQRAQRTAELAGLTVTKTDPDLWEWDYGGYEGITTPEIQQTRPGWSLWRDGVIPGDAGHPGETVEEVGERVDRVLKRAAPLLADGDVALVAHGHVLRILTARYLGLPPSDGRLFRLDTGTVSTLGAEHDDPVVLTWNVPPTA